MASKTRKRIWPVALAMPLAIVGALAVFLVLAGNSSVTDAHSGPTENHCAGENDTYKQSHDALTPSAHPQCVLGPASGLSVSAGTTAGTATVTWTPGPGATMHWIYAIRAVELEGGYTFEQASSNGSHTLTGLNSGVEYIVGISAGKGQLPGGEWSEWAFTRVTPN